MAGTVLTRCVSRTLLSVSGAKNIRIRGTNRRYWTASGRTATELIVNNDGFYSYSSYSAVTIPETVKIVNFYILTDAQLREFML